MRAAVVASALVAGLFVAPATAAAAPAETLTNTAHLDFLLDEVPLTEVPGHSTYRLAEDPSVELPWTYADARPGGTFERIGGGPLDPATGDYAQGAFNSDDVSRAAVVYLRHWELTGSTASRDRAYEVLRALAYFQTTDGPDAGNVVLWMQSDGELNPSAEPVELPDPSDSEDSYWLARTIWAFGEGHAAFRDADPAFAAFLEQRLALAVGAVDREVLGRYGQYAQADGVRVPAWLIVDGADASAEAVLGLAAYVPGASDRATGTAARRALAKLADGIAAMGTPTRSWPYGAILPWAQSRSMWHAWASQMPAALASASTVLDDRRLLRPALADSASFTPTLLAAGGPDNAWFPTPVDRTQIAYGADSRVQSLLAVADAAERPGLRELAGLQAAWFFGANAAGQPVYDPATGVTFDGIAPDGTVNRNSGAESAIHGLLTMLALDARPDVRERATGVTGITARDGLTVVEAETARGGTVVPTDPAYTGESQFGGAAVLALPRGAGATLALPGEGARLVEAVLDVPADGVSRTRWERSGTVTARAGAQGITAVPGVLRPYPLPRPVDRAELTVQALSDGVRLDAVLLRPEVSRLQQDGPGGSTELLVAAGPGRQRATVGADGRTTLVRTYDAGGALTSERTVTTPTRVALPAGGFLIATT